MLTEKMVYLSLGGNLGDRKGTLEQALRLIAGMSEVKDFQTSSFYETSPMYLMQQANYLNAVCRFQTKLEPFTLFKALQSIEKCLGKEPKPKNYPRIIDIDVLFYGTESYQDKDLKIPHCSWKERLFVIIPLLELTKTITVSSQNNGEETIDLIQLRDSLPNLPNQACQFIKKYEI